MIQRIQTLWLALAVLLSIEAFFFPVAIFEFTYKDGPIPITYKLIPSQSDPIPSQPAWSLLVGNVLVGVICLITIFLYKNRTLQRKILAIAFLLTAIEILLVYFYQLDSGLKQVITYLCQGTPEIIPSTIAGAKITYGFASFFPIVQILCFVFALKGIRKDEALVRSADRIR